jgi:hypothetical protein
LFVGLYGAGSIWQRAQRAITQPRARCAPASSGAKADSSTTNSTNSGDRLLLRE